jgi:hypothetical protein
MFLFSEDINKLFVVSYEIKSVDNPVILIISLNKAFNWDFFWTIHVASGFHVIGTATHFSLFDFQICPNNFILSDGGL